MHPLLADIHDNLPNQVAGRSKYQSEVAAEEAIILRWKLVSGLI
jgi:hypothetical protein